MNDKYKIVIFGTGKAAKLHYLSYKKFLNEDMIVFIDPLHKPKYNNIVIYKTLKDFLVDTNFPPSKVIIDICTPYFVFDSIIQECKSNHLYNIIVEKPFVANIDDFKNKYLGLNICMVQNYLYSNITKLLKQLILKYNLQIEELNVDFSKNRVIDSFNNRGMIANKVTNVFEVEFPHELYISDYLLDLHNNFNIIDLKVSDMVVNNKVIKNHGYGCIIAKKDTIKTKLESNLMNGETIKRLKVRCKGNILLEANYLIYDKDINLIKKGNVCVKHNDRVIYYKDIDYDDNMLECLKDYYYYFISGKVEDKYKNRILSFSQLMTKINQKEFANGESI